MAFDSGSSASNVTITQLIDDNLGRWQKPKQIKGLVWSANHRARFLDIPQSTVIKPPCVVAEDKVASLIAPVMVSTFSSPVSLSLCDKYKIRLAGWHPPGGQNMEFPRNYSFFFFFLLI